MKERTVSPALPCPFYRMPCEYVPMANRTNALAAENAKLRSALAFLYDATTNPEANTVIPAAIREARAALGGENG